MKNKTDIDYKSVAGETPNAACFLNALKGHRHRAQGWPRFLRPTLGESGNGDNPERVAAI
jgi:hypothetical protein